MVFMLVFLFSWTAFFCLFQRKRFREILPTSLLAMVLGLTSDVITNSYPFWTYVDGKLPHAVISILDDYGLYFVVSYLYIQFLPSTFRKWWLYTFCWTLACLTFEFLYVKSGHMIHRYGWSLLSSYFADWVILGSLTCVHLWLVHGMKSKQAHPAQQPHAMPNYDVSKMICYKDAKGRLLAANEQLTALLQERGVSYYGKTDQEIAEANEQLREAFLSCRDTDRITWETGVPCHFTGGMPNSNGEMMTMEVTKVPTYDTDGQRMGIYVLERMMPEVVQPFDQPISAEQNTTTI